MCASSLARPRAERCHKRGTRDRRHALEQRTQKRGLAARLEFREQRAWVVVVAAAGGVGQGRREGRLEALRELAVGRDERRSRASALGDAELITPALALLPRVDLDLHVVRRAKRERHGTASEAEQVLELVLASVALDAAFLESLRARRLVVVVVGGIGAVEQHEEPARIVAPPEEATSRPHNARDEDGLARSQRRVLEAVGLARAPRKLERRASEQPA